MATPLMISSILRFAERNHPNVEIVSMSAPESTHRYRYRDWAARSRQLAKALQRMGASRGDRAGTLAWNGHRHLEVYYATSGSGLVCHTINPRLFPEQLAYIIRHAGALHAWGMTEMSPLGVINTLKPVLARLPDAQRVLIEARQGRAPFGVELKIVDDAGAELPWDGKTSGALKVRGPWVADGYFTPDESVESHDAAGWFATGDVATIDPDGYLQITDRTKDVIKSGGEWISSIELENATVAHPAIAEAAAIAVPHPKWGERPLLLCLCKPDVVVSADELLSFMRSRVASWWLPDETVFVEALPHTATGKLNKRELREQYGNPAPVQ